MMEGRGRGIWGRSQRQIRNARLISCLHDDFVGVSTIRVCQPRPVAFHRAKGGCLGSKDTRAPRSEDDIDFKPDELSSGPIKPGESPLALRNSNMTLLPSIQPRSAMHSNSGRKDVGNDGPGRGEQWTFLQLSSILALTCSGSCAIHRFRASAVE